MKKNITYFSLISIWIICLFLAKPVFAEEEIGGTILPGEYSSADVCNTILSNFKTEGDLEKEIKNSDRATSASLLGCTIKTGRVKLWMIPYFIRYLVEFLISLAGIICLFFIVLGGYYYLFGGLGQDQEKGKKTILYACLGLIVVSLAWIIVNIVLYAASQ